MTRLRLALCLLLLCMCCLAWSPSWNRPELPTKGLNGTGIGYCVSVESPDGAVLGMVDVPFHVINPEQRKKHGLPPLQLSEFEASVRNATALVVGAEAAKRGTWVCSQTYRDRTGQVLGCRGGCADCVLVKVKTIQ